MLVDPCIWAAVLICLIGITLIVTNLPKKVVDTEIGDVIHFDYWLDQDDGWYGCKHSSDEFTDVQDLGVCATTKQRYYKVVDNHGEIHFFKVIR